MVATAQNVKDDFNQMLAHGDQIRLKYFTISGATSGYDDDKAYTQSGTDVWTSGLVQPLDQSRGSADAVLMQQGRLLTDDIKVYVKGTEDTSGLWTIGIGSPVRREYAMADAGVIAWKYQGTDVYKKCYIRYLTSGSLT